MTEKSKRWLKASIFIEIVGIAIVGTGVGIEAYTHEPFGLLVITIGSLTVAAGSALLVKCQKLFK